MSETKSASEHDETGPYFEAAARGELLLKRCIDTGQMFHYPREHSPFTGGRTEWAKASGCGEIYACSLAYRAKPMYCIAYVRLDEGPIMLSNIEHEDLTKVQIGQRVKAVFREAADGLFSPFFVLAC